MKGPMSNHCNCEDRVVELENEIEGMLARVERLERMIVADYDAEECLPIIIGDPHDEDE